MFEPVSNRVKFPELEEKILRFWEEHQTFEKSMQNREGNEEYVFYDGPPFATGLPHYGHLLAGTIKDIIPRYQTMRGHYVSRRFGWDCHGLPIEALAQKALGLAGTTAIVENGVDTFNEQCRSMVQTYVGEWRKTVNRMGRWVDFDNDYKTMDLDFMESVWWVFKQVWDQDRIYKSHRIMPYSWALTTPLSNFEANNYKNVQDPAVTIRVKLTESDFEGEAWILAWTTTPWTLPANLAMCMGPDIDYVAVRDGDEGGLLIMAEARLSAYYKKEEDYDVVRRFKGSEGKGWRYEPLLDYFADQPNAFVVLNDDYVTTEDGTGIVHIAPAYGEDDYRIGKAVGIEMVDPLDNEANFTDVVPEFAGQNCKAADKGIIKLLKERGRLVRQSTIRHEYPYCERTDTPLIYRAIDAWYIRVEDVVDKLVANNDQVHWMPEHVGTKRFGNWLKNAKDWNISRNRFWGSCLPVWVSEDGEDMMCFGSIQELEDACGLKVDDLHKHTLDKIVIEKDGKSYARTPEVLDCWFESGSMPYAQGHYPFEGQDTFEANFPANFIAEGLDQTRGWFYTLTVLSTLLFDKPAFRNVVVNGMILAADGTKMSKSKQNYPPPEEVIDRYGADALRLYLINSPVVRGESMRFVKDEEDRLSQEKECGKPLPAGIRTVEQTVRELLLPLWNSYSFFVTYANVDGWEPGEELAPSTNLLDRWILSALDRLTAGIVGAMDDYNLQASIKPLTEFIDELTNWYIRTNRRRFWKSEDDDDKHQAYGTLYTVLLRLSQISAPFTPFVSEMIFRNLRTEDLPESVHLCDFPTADGKNRDDALEQQMSVVQSVVGLGRALRSEYDLKVRQPLPGIHVVTTDMSMQKNVDDLKHLVMDELNVKEVRFGDDETELANLSARPNFKLLGPRLGKKVKAATGVIAQLSTEEVERLLKGESLSVDVEGTPLELTGEDLVVERTPRDGLAVASEGSLVVALEKKLTPELIAEGLARELVNKVQNLRKDQGLDVSDRIQVDLSGPAEVVEAAKTHENYIKNEVLCLAIRYDSEGVEGVCVDVNGYECVVCVVKYS